MKRRAVRRTLPQMPLSVAIQTQPTKTVSSLCPTALRLLLCPSAAGHSNGSMFRQSAVTSPQSGEKSHWLHIAVRDCLLRRTWSPKRATLPTSDLAGGASRELPHLCLSSFDCLTCRSCKGANKSFTDSCMRRLRFLILPYHYTWTLFSSLRISLSTRCLGEG